VNTARYLLVKAACRVAQFALIPAIIVTQAPRLRNLDPEAAVEQVWATINEFLTDSV
jgi:hypothetical protein